MIEQGNTESVGTEDVTTAGGDTLTSEEQFQALLDKLVSHDSETIEVPEDTDFATKKALEAELKAQKLTKAYEEAEAKLAVANKRIEASSSLALKGAKEGFTKEQLEELNDLKELDLEAWRVKYNELEKERDTKAKEVLESINTVDVDSIAKELHATKLQAFNASLDGEPLTLDELSDELPPKYLKAVKEGSLTYEAYLTKAYEFLRKPVTTTRITEEVEVTSSREEVDDTTYNILDDSELII